MKEAIWPAGELTLRRSHQGELYLDRQPTISLHNYINSVLAIEKASNQYYTQDLYWDTYDFFERYDTHTKISTQTRT